MEDEMIIKNNHPFLSFTCEMIELSKPLLKLGITYFTYTRSYDTGERLYLSSHYESLENYFRKKWYLSGNVEGKPSAYKPQTVLWSTLPKQHIYDDNVRSRGIDHGMFMIDPQFNYCDFYGFATKKENVWVQNVYLNKLDVLKKFTLYFKEKASAIIGIVEKSKIILPFHNDSVEFMRNKLEIDFGKMNFRKKIHNSKFTDRQLKCAYLLTQGNTIKEIACQIGLSPRTIEDHVNTLKKKLNCRNKSELIIKIMENF